MAWPTELIIIAIQSTRINSQGEARTRGEGIQERIIFGKLEDFLFDESSTATTNLLGSSDSSCYVIFKMRYRVMYRSVRNLGWKLGGSLKLLLMVFNQLGRPLDWC